LQVAAGVFFSIGGLALTVIWYLSTRKTWGYVRHWWESIQTLERELPLAPYDFAQQLQRKQEQLLTIKYRTLVFWIPLLFCGAWIGMFLVAAVRLVCPCASVPHA
jgi:hypothetical protein